MTGAALLLGPVALIARVYFHSELRQESAWQLGFSITLSAIVDWGAKICGLREEFRAAARWINIASCGVLLSEALENLAAHVAHIYALALYGTSLETPLQHMHKNMHKNMCKKPSWDLERLSQLAAHFFLALANFHVALSGNGAEYWLFSNSALLLRQFRFKRKKFASQLENLLPGQPVAPATDLLLRRVYNRVHVTTTERLTGAAKSVLTTMGLLPAETSTQETPPTEVSICWTATPAIC